MIQAGSNLQVADNSELDLLAVLKLLADQKEDMLGLGIL